MIIFYLKGYSEIDVNLISESLKIPNNFRISNFLWLLGFASLRCCGHGVLLKLTSCFTIVALQKTENNM